MDWLRRLTEYARRGNAIAELADEIAERAFDSVWQRVYPEVVELPLGEARGYVRARAAIVVQRHIDLVLATSQGSRLQRSQLNDVVMRSVARRVANQTLLMQARRQVTPKAA